MLILADMFARNKDAVICDLAETYHIYDYTELPCSRVALFAVGLRENSRIKTMMSNMKYSLDTTMLASILDRLSILVWFNTEDGRKGINRPTMITDKFYILDKRKDSDIIAFDTPEEYERYRQLVLEKG